MIRAWILGRSQGPFVAVCVLVAILMTAAYARGRASGKADCAAHYKGVIAQRDLAEARSLSEQVEQQRQQLELAHAIERRHLEDQLKRAQEAKVVTRVVKEYVQARPALAGCDVDAHGVRLWNAANAGRATGTGTKARGKRP
nr:MAG TPA: hypothetical protein [Caudoviricetes sp.]